MTEDASSALPDRRRPVHLPLLDADTRSNLVFLTVCTKARRPLLANARLHEILRTEWQAAGNWRVGRYVVMPDHVHLFCSPGTLPASGLRAWVGYWKRLVTQASGEEIWQKNFWDTQLRRHESYGAKWEYVRQNPVRAGLASRAEGWPYQGELNTLYWLE
ncbi:MAG: transposase [Opitutae bacterium]|nr:transposase [Opitutae bacterium]